MIDDWTNAEEFAEQAHQLYRNGRWEEALSKLRLAVWVDPLQSDWHFGMGLILDALSRYKEAVDSFEQALELGGDDVEVLLHLAEDLIRIDRCPAAVDALQRVSKIDPDCEPAYCLRIYAHARLGEHDEAEQAFYLAQQIDEACPRCFDFIAHSLAVRGQIDRAVWCWHKTLELDPRHRHVWARLGQVCRLRGQAAEAEQCFIKELRQAPKDTDTLLQLASLQIELGRFSAARHKLGKVVEQDPANAQAHLHLAMIALQEGHIESAAAELELTHRLDAQLPGVHLGLAQVAFQRGATDLTLRHIAKELRCDDRSSLIDLDLARLLLEMGQPQQASLLLSARLDQHGGGFTSQDHLVAALHYRATALLKMGLIDRGALECRRALRIAPDHSPVIKNLLLARLSTGQHRKAAYWLDRLTQLDPHDAQLAGLRRRLWRARIRRLFSRITWGLKRDKLRV